MIDRDSEEVLRTPVQPPVVTRLDYRPLRRGSLAAARPRTPLAVAVLAVRAERPLTVALGDDPADEFDVAVGAVFETPRGISC